MEALIQNADFFHDDTEIHNSYNRKVSDWRDENDEKTTGSQVLSAIKVFNKKLTQGKCPKYDTYGWKQAEDLFDDLICRVSSELIDNNKLKPDDMRSAYYNLYIDWFRYGPSTVQLKIMEETFSNSDIDMGEYMKNLTGEPRAKMISAMMSPINKTEDTEDGEFYLEHQRGVERFIQNAFENSSLLEGDTMKLWFTHSIDLSVNYLHLSDEALDRLESEANDRFREIEDGWEDFADVKCLKSAFEMITKATKTAGFPKSKQAASILSKPISKMYRKLTKPGEAETYSDCIFDLLEAVSTCKGDKVLVLDIFDTALRFIDNQERDILTKRTPFFKAVAPRFKTLLGKLDMRFLQGTKYSSMIVDKLEYAYANNKALVVDWLALIVPLLKRPCYNTFRAAYTVIRCDAQIRWKDHKGVAKEAFQCLTQVQIPMDQDKNTKEFIEEYKTCVEYFIRGLEKARILKEFGEGMMFLGINILELKSDRKDVFNLVEKIGEHIEINVKENKEKVMEVMKRIHLVLKDENLPWTESWPLQRAIEDTINSIIDPVNDGRIFADNDLRVFAAMCHTCLKEEALNPNASFSAHFGIANIIMGKMIGWMASTKRLGYAVKLIPLLLSKFDDDEEKVSIVASRHLNDFATGEAATMTPYLEQLITAYLEKDDINILTIINTTYPFNPAPMKKHFQVMLNQLIDSGEPQVTTKMIQLFGTASKKQPELFTEKNLRDIIDKAKNDPGNQAMLVQILQEVSKRKPERMVKHIDILMDKKGWEPTLYPWLNDMLTTLALYDKSQANKVISHCMQTIETNPHDKGLMLTSLNSIRLIGFKYPDVIKPRRPDVVKLQITDPDGQSLKQTVLDMVDGKTPDDLRKQMEKQQKEMSNLVGRVEEVELAVIAVKDELDEQGQELDNVKNEVNVQGQRLDQVEETVEETVAKVEEIDSKTLSHAPYWSRDISKLLNPVTEHDWRLLSSRLGYSNADIRGWAQQADPCMAMLNEWYATRKTSEASYAVLTNLQEMNRMDAALIVENAMKKAEAVVEDEEFEYASPPEIFISYQWGHQDEVKLLHRHLGMAGYDCWMDIGQMGGGDKLFEKIDNGMRAAKLVISCVTAKYAKSPNCNREVNLAVGVKKPIIPLLFENCTWPPPGSMGPIFSESLYIQFFQTGNQETKDNRFWPEEKFQELLMQLSVNGLTPDEGKIEKIYRNWWMPLEEEITIDKSKTRNGGKQVEVAKKGDNTESEETPEVFISYQWGKQKNIIKLYQRLTSLGFSCWLDIKQMGGGDSLYDKIDRGIRGCKVVVSCVTKKYALSPNCRREVSLTDALKKPLLPLLLEEMTWPPTGPMSMILTQLLYIGFQQESAQMNWGGPQFDELISKINLHLGIPMTQKSISPKPDNKSSQPTEHPSKTPTAKSSSKPDASESRPKGNSSHISPKDKPASQENRSSERHKPPSSNNTSNGAGRDAKPQPAPARNPSPPKPSPPAQPSPQENTKSKSCSIL